MFQLLLAASPLAFLLDNPTVNLHISNPTSERPAGYSCLKPGNVAGVYAANGPVVQEVITPDEHISYSWTLVTFKMTHFIQTINITGGWDGRVKDLAPSSTCLNHLRHPDWADPQFFVQADVIGSQRYHWAWLHWRTNALQYTLNRDSPRSACWTSRYSALTDQRFPFAHIAHATAERVPFLRADIYKIAMVLSPFLPKASPAFHHNGGNSR